MIQKDTKIDKGTILNLDIDARPIVDLVYQSNNEVFARGKIVAADYQYSVIVTEVL